MGEGVGDRASDTPFQKNVEMPFQFGSEGKTTQRPDEPTCPSALPPCGICLNNRVTVGIIPNPTSVRKPHEIPNPESQKALMAIEKVNCPGGGASRPGEPLTILW